MAALAVTLVCTCTASADDYAYSPAKPHRISTPNWTENPAIAPKTPCTCRFKGKDVMLGESVCMKTPKGFVKARCSRMLNNTSWDITKQPCDAVS